MGYRRERTIYKLVFEDPAMDGLEVRVRSISIGKIRQLTGVRADQLSPAETDAESDAMFAEFAKALVDWNLEDDQGQPVPASLEGIDTQDADFILTIINAWMETVTGVPKGSPLPATSNSGGLFPEGSIPMVPLSASPSPFQKLSS